MYEKHFQLRERPFALSPDPDYLYPSKGHVEALSYLRYGIEGHAGFVVITGEIGSGKTTMLQALLGRLDQNTALARIVNTLLEPRELLDAIMLDFGIDPSAMSKPVLLRALAAFLVQQREAGKLTLLVIDEAQNLSPATLEEIRMLSNLETEKSKLLQIIMIGQPDLRETLAQPKLEQLRQRITVSYHLQPLDATETANYVNHRLKRAALSAPLEFPRDVTDLIHARSRGVPRVINIIADATLLFAYGVDRREIDVAITQEALAELEVTSVLAPLPAASAATVPDTPATMPAVPLAPVESPVAAATATAVALAQPTAAAATAAALPGTSVATPAVRDIGRPAPNRILAPQSTAPASSPAAPTSSHVAPTASHIAPTSRPLAPTTSPVALTSGRLVPTASHLPPSRRVLAPAARPSVVLANGVRVQRYNQLPQPTPGIWDRLRRVLFGTTEAGA
jgi:putative secretion ATPase (PEP-CTERM system associated)